MPEILPSAARLNNPKLLDQVRAAVRSTTTARAGAGLCGLDRSDSMKYWEIIADNLSKAGWSRGCVSAIDSNGQTIWIVDAHRADGRHKTMNLFQLWRRVRRDPT